ncbi:MAG: DUF72 domain-containing protein [Candidatus Firestonebacteria bacterium]|nr:DUF72 domain-containing protein [Candidatus Firestonebacteria bacterium]
MKPAAPTPEPNAPSCDLRVGTSGYSYTEWIEAGFYPQGTPSGKMLPVYAQNFTATELNHTWYQMPRADMLERQRQMVPPDFWFAAKLTRTLTHEVDPRGWRAQALAFRQGVAPLVQARQLAAVLVQLPPSFDYAVPHRRYLNDLLTELEGLPLAVEFRHKSWLQDAVFAGLAERRVTLVTVDEPQLPDLLPPLTLVTNPDLLYVRFHGRNTQGWRSGKMQLQFDYDYSGAELREWATERIRPMAERAGRGVLFFNNHVRGQAPRTAQALKKTLVAEGLPVR